MWQASNQSDGSEAMSGSGVTGNTPGGLPGDGGSSPPLPLQPSLFAGLAKGVYLVQVTTDELRELWNEIVLTYHSYRADTKFAGRRLDYLIYATDAAGNPLYPIGALGFGSAILPMPRCLDRFIGWTRLQRTWMLRYVVYNYRFTLTPAARPNDGSKVLGLVRRLLPRDWERKYGWRPVLLVSFLGPGKKGTVYRAAGWRVLGYTKGYVFERNPYNAMGRERKSRPRRRYRQQIGTEKLVLALPLQEDWRQLLRWRGPPPPWVGEDVAGDI
jgi:hypothetical protein